MTNVSILDETPGSIVGSGTDWRETPVAEGAGANAHPATPLIAAASAAVICAVIAAAGWLLAPQGWLLGLIGLPGATVLAWRMGHHVATATRPGAAGIALGLAIGTILIADALVVVMAAVAASIGSLDSWAVDGGATFLATLVGGIVVGLFLFVIGAIVVGIPVAIVVVPAAFIWAALVRFLVGRLA